MSRLPVALVVTALVVGGCRNKTLETGETDIDTDTAIDTDTDTDTGTDTDVDTDSDTEVLLVAPQGFAFCAAGGRVTGGTYEGILCLGPLDVATEPVSDGTYTWQPGPIYILAP